MYQWDLMNLEGALKMNIDYEWIAKAIETIKSGFVKRLDNADKTIKVYQCGSIIRVDIKN